MRLSSADRKLLIGALLLILLLATLTGTLAAPETGELIFFPSSYSASPRGALAGYLLLKNLHLPVSRWEDPPARLVRVDPRAILILAEPMPDISPAQKDHLHRFVAGGGRIVFCGPALPKFFPSITLTSANSALSPLSVVPDLPSSFTWGVHSIVIPPQSYWNRLHSSQVALFGGDTAPLVVLWHIGKGELVWWASARPLTNRGLTQADNLHLFLNAVSTAPGESPRPIYWDEYFHGSRGTLWSYVARTPVKWALVQCALLTLAVLFAFSRRSGPVAPEPAVSRLYPLEFVQTLGGLYQRAGATEVATGIAYRHLRVTLARRLSLPSTASDFELALAAEQRLGWSRSEFAPAIQKAGSAQHRNLPPLDALIVVQTIGHYLDRLRHRRQPSSETL